MIVHVESTFACPADVAWAEVLKSDRLSQVSWPVVVLAPVGLPQLPEIWREQQSLRVASFLFGLIRLAPRRLTFERIDHLNRRIQTRESDALVRRWDHLIAIDEADAGHCRYTDEVEIDAGPWTLFVWLFAQFFYRHRQRRWRSIARQLSATTNREIVP